MKAGKILLSYIAKMDLILVVDENEEADGNDIITGIMHAKDEEHIKNRSELKCNEVVEVVIQILYCILYLRLLKW